MEMEAQEIQTLKPTYSRLNASEEKWLSIPLSAYRIDLSGHIRLKSSDSMLVMVTKGCEG